MWIEYLALSIAVVASVFAGLAILWGTRQQSALKAQIQSQAQESFKALAAQALEGNARQFMELAQTTLQKENAEARHDLELRQSAIAHLLKPLESNLTRYEQQLRDLEMNRQRSFVGIELELKKVVESSTQLSHVTTALKDALKKPHIRGRWGELQLKNCIELAGMSEHCDVQFQDVTVDEGGERAIPDMTVRMPGGRVIVVDCKTPLDAFLASLEATTEEARVAEMIRHGRHVKDHVKKLSTRAYVDALKESPDFTVMFLPNESFLYAALECEADLVEYALQKKVLVATPPTLVGLLKVVRFGWNEEKLAQNAMKISAAGQELHKRLVDFVEAYTDVGKHLEKAKAEYDVGFARLERRVLVQARKMESLGIHSSKQLPEGLGMLDDHEVLQ
jgi:DNA recombination protein RmuC